MTTPSPEHFVWTEDAAPEYFNTLEEARQAAEEADRMLGSIPEE